MAVTLAIKSEGINYGDGSVSEDWNSSCAFVILDQNEPLVTLDLSSMTSDVSQTLEALGPVSGEGLPVVEAKTPTKDTGSFASIYIDHTKNLDNICDNENNGRHTQLTEFVHLAFKTCIELDEKTLDESKGMSYFYHDVEEVNSSVEVPNSFLTNAKYTRLFTDPEISAEFQKYISSQVSFSLPGTVRSFVKDVMDSANPVKELRTKLAESAKTFTTYKEVEDFAKACESKVPKALADKLIDPEEGILQACLNTPEFLNLLSEKCKTDGCQEVLEKFSSKNAKKLWSGFVSVPSNEFEMDVMLRILRPEMSATSKTR